MGTKQTTTSSNTYDPTSMNAFKQGTPAWSDQAMNFVKNPYSNPQFGFESMLGNKNAGQQNQGMMSNITRGLNSYGMAQNSPAGLEMMNNQMRANTANTAMQGFINPTQMANQRQQNSMGLLQGYHPLQTGGQQVQSTGGLGTWLPQLAGAAMGAAGNMASGGMFGAMSGLGSKALGMSGSLPQQSFWQQNGSSGYAPLGGLQDPWAASGSGGYGGSGMMPWGGG